MLGRMETTRIYRCSLGGLSLAVLLASSSARGQTSSLPSHARDDSGAACDALALEWRRGRDPDVALKHAICLAAMGRDVDAMRVAWRLRQTEAKSADFPKRLHAFIADNLLRVASVSLRSARRGAFLFVDGWNVGQAPLAEPVFVAPGEHVFEARADGARVTETLRVWGGESPSINLAPSTSSPAERRPSMERWRLLTVTLGASVALFAAGAAVYFSIAMTNAREARLERIAEIGISGCFNRETVACAKLTELSWKEHQLDLARWVSIGLAGVGLLTVPIALKWPEPRRPAIGISFLVTPELGGLVVRGAF